MGSDQSRDLIAHMMDVRHGDLEGATEAIYTNAERIDSLRAKLTVGEQRETALRASLAEAEAQLAHASEVGGEHYREWKAAEAKLARYAGLDLDDVRNVAEYAKRSAHNARVQAAKRVLAAIDAHPEQPSACTVRQDAFAHVCAECDAPVDLSKFVPVQPAADDRGGEVPCCPVCRTRGRVSPMTLALGMLTCASCKSHIPPDAVRAVHALDAGDVVRGVPRPGSYEALRKACESARDALAEMKAQGLVVPEWAEDAHDECRSALAGTGEA